jgi:thioesterase domain-containing protein
MRALIQSINAADRSPWPSLIPIQPAGTRVPVFFAHSVGGEVLSYLELALQLGDDQPVYAFQARGLAGEAKPLETIPEQAAVYVRDLLKFRPHGPYFIGGHSHGARVAFEMAVQMEALSKAPDLVALIDMWPSEVVPRGALWPFRFGLNLGRWVADDVLRSSRRENLDRLRRGILLVRRQLRRLRRGLAEDRTPSVGEHMDVRRFPDSVRAVYDANFRSFMQYRPGAYGGRVTVYRVATQPLRSPLLPDHGWSRHAAAVTTVRVPGTHLTVINQPNVARLAAAMGRTLALEADRLRAAAVPAPVPAPWPGPLPHVDDDRAAASPSA